MGGGRLRAPYWVTGVLLYSRQNNKKGGREGKDEEKRSERRRRRRGGLVVNVGVIEGHGERDGGRRAAAFWLLSKGSVAPCEQTKILVS